MGTGHSTRRDSFDADGEVNFDHFQILRAIGKGSFGKVCIVQKKDTKKMFAMKYMNKQMCLKKDAILNVMKEVDILKTLDHPFLVNLWFTFQDEEDMFVVVDLLLGGDLRYHMQQDIVFTEEQVKLYICEIGLALNYLKTHDILHRDLKPDNILLDEGGHVHITDFNIATVLKPGDLATSMSGTKPYMAPEVFACAANEFLGYSFPVDWWSLGVTAYELLKGRRPYDIHSVTPLPEVQAIFNSTKPHYSSSLSENFRDLLKQLIEVDPDNRIYSLAQLKQHPIMNNVDFNKIYNKEIKPIYVPSKEHLNCDPTYELEEMIIETKPLHKKKKRLAKQNSRRAGELLSQSSTEMDEIQKHLLKLNEDFVSYNRERKLEKESQQEDKEVNESHVT